MSTPESINIAGVVRHQTFNTASCADSVEFCPLPAHTDVVVVGNYQLHDDQRKTGKVYVYELEKDTSKEGLALTEKQCVDTEAVFDLKWYGLFVSVRVCVCACVRTSAGAHPRAHCPVTRATTHTPS